MFKFLISASIFLTSAVFAQSFKIEKTILCDDTQKIVTILVNNFGEQPVWIGTEEKLKYSLFISVENQTWTLIQYTESKTCVIDSGIGFQFRKDIFNNLKTF